MKPLKRLQRKRPVEDKKDTENKSHDSETDDDEEDAEDEQEQIQKAIKERKTVHFYNIKPSQDIQDVTGCTPEQADKLIALRPFKDIDELRDTLQQERGLSVRFINSYIDMMDGYTVVDQIIENIEDLGGELKSIVNVWEGVDIDAIQDDQEDTGMHLSGAAVSDKKNNTNSSDIDESSDLYRDAMDGFLTEQPKIVNDDFKLKDYQLVGINWMLMLYRKGISGILADEMGLGKTAQVISFLGRLYELGNKGPHLIIVPTSTLDNWLREFERFCPDLNVYGYYGTQAERFDMREELMDEETKGDYQVIVTTYTVATGNVDDRKFLRRLKCKSMILDEGHMIRNCTSARYTHLMALKTPFRLLLTGTPLQNNLQELVSLLMFIMPKLLVDYEEEIRKIFKIKAVTNATKDSRTASSSAQILSQGRIERAKKMMTPFVLRRRKADVLKDLPQKMHVIERCKMTKSQQNLYNTILSESKQSYKEALDSKPGQKKDKLDRFKNIVMELRKAADHPMLFRYIYDDGKLRKMAKAIMKEEKYWDANEEYIYEDMTVMSDFELNRLCKDHKSISKFALKKQEWMDSGKVEKLKELLPAMKAKEQKVLLFSQFTSLLDIIELVMDTLNIKYLRLDGETKPAERQERIDQFNEDKDIDVFLLSTKAGGFGINLTSANIVVLYDTDFNPQNDRQAEDRAHRVGQTRDVTVYKMVAENSVEEHILRMADIKLRLDRSVSGLGEDTEGEADEQVEKKNVHSLLKTVLLS
ncbi:SNF2 family N-terminal domain-containing protein [Zychaea mexicana]|uniref:SNF2 family N-terminal domain-containing protein n=1 Tax=Zychaea mexicana TaxID=64656 RepID=UPI0022FF428D|nr:SNF2 family N-terminal domain-containing protein [Zychaea mexicana]KAI9491570.1 SNF2 family N-terminal domain-containing protein [Zychaea mexicana]